MSRIFSTVLIIFLIFFIFISIILSTVGIETDRFNYLITQKINQSNNFVNINLNKINYKFDIKEIKLFLETEKTNLLSKSFDTR